MNGNVIVNVGIGAWYPRGSQRLIKSLYNNGYTGSVMYFNYYPDNCPTHEENPYAFKVYAMCQAARAGFRNIAWIDSSIFCVREPDSLFTKIIEKGYYFVENGYKIGQETNDFCLNYFGMDRDEAMDKLQISSGFWGIDLLKYADILKDWERAMQAGCFKGSREHNAEESKDPRFLHHRQDQSALSCILTKYGIEIDKFGNLFDYEGSGKQCNFLSHGM